MSEATTRAYQLKSDPSVIVQAVQFDPHEYPWPEGILPWSTAKYRPRDASWGYIDTSSKREHVWNGDYIVLDRLGKPYPVRPQLFEDAYHPAIVLGLGKAERPIMLKWVERNGTECTEGGLDEDELTLRTIKLLMRYLEGDVLKIGIEH